MPFSISFIGSSAEIVHINLRKQGDDNNRVLAIDVKLAGETKSEVLNELLGVALEDDVSGLLWSTIPGEDPESLRMLSLNSISVDAAWSNRLLTLGKQEVVGDVKKISFVPRPGHRLDLTVSVTIQEPRKELLDYLVDNVQDRISCRIDSQPELDLQPTATK